MPPPTTVELRHARPNRHDQAARHDKREAAVAIISGVPIRGKARADDAERAIKKLGIKVSPVRIGHRVAFIDATDRGAGVTELAPKDKKIRALYKWLKGVRP